MAIPLDERTIGSAPYEEALAKARASGLRGAALHIGNIIGRIGQRQRLIAALAGMGSFKQNEPLGANILNVLGGVGRARMQQGQQESLDAYREQQRLADLARQDAEARQKEKPPPPPKPPDPLLPYKLESARLKVEKQKYDLSHPKQPAGAKPKSAPKESAARLNKLRKEMAAFPHATPEELQMMATDATLEPETQRRAMAALRRYQNPQSPSQVPP